MTIGAGSAVGRAHEWLSVALQPGCVALDMTAGNGHDTRFLAEKVGCDGRVVALDVQQVAIDKTKALLERHGLSGRANLITGSHADMARILTEAGVDYLHAAVANLGYLPGGDKAIVTEIDSTLVALRAACRLLQPGGRLAVVAYPGHEQGGEECVAVIEWAEKLSSEQWTVYIDPPPETRRPAPRAILVEKIAGA